MVNWRSIKYIFDCDNIKMFQSFQDKVNDGICRKQLLFFPYSDMEFFGRLKLLLVRVDAARGLYEANIRITVVLTLTTAGN
jgi:hypothetical protein